jgi:hypothetical protein
MQYLASVIDDKTGSATPAEMAAIDAFNDRLEAEGHWVFAGGLNSPSTATGQGQRMARRGRGPDDQPQRGRDEAREPRPGRPRPSRNDLLGNAGDQIEMISGAKTGHQFR